MALRDSALGASSNQGRHHVTDPRTDRAVVGPRLAVITGPSARRCDAWSTAALVLGVRPDALPAGYEAVFVGSG